VREICDVLVLMGVEGVINMVMIQEYCGLEFQIWDSSPRSWRL